MALLRVWCADAARAHGLTFYVQAQGWPNLSQRIRKEIAKLDFDADSTVRGSQIGTTFVVHPVVAGREPRLLDGIRDQIQLELVARREFRSGASVQRYRPV